MIAVGLGGLWLYNSNRLGGVWAYLHSPPGSVAILQAPAGSTVGGGGGMVCTSGSGGGSGSAGSGGAPSIQDIIQYGFGYQQPSMGSTLGVPEYTPTFSPGN